MFRKYVRFSLTNICSEYIIVLEQLFDYCTEDIIMNGRLNYASKDFFNELDTNTQPQSRLDRSERLVKRELRQQQVKRTKFNIFIIVAILLINITIIACTLLSNAQEIETKDNYTVHYISYEIESGDSLWSIAQEYKSNPELSTKEAVNEIKEINHLSKETIYEGQYIIVAKYVINE